MGQTISLPPDFPGLEDCKPGDKKKFIIEAEYTDDSDNDHDFTILTVDGVKLPDDSDQAEDAEQQENPDEEQQEGEGNDAMAGYDTSQDEPSEGESEDMTSEGKPKTTKGIAMLILHGKPKK